MSLTIPIYLTYLSWPTFRFFHDNETIHTHFVIAGGPCTCNPEPVADFFDAIVVGDGEKVIMEMSQAWLEWKARGKRDKETLLRKWSQIEGVYIP